MCERSKLRRYDHRRYVSQIGRAVNQFETLGDGHSGEIDGI